MGSRKPPRESQPAINHAFKKSQDLIPSQNPFNGPNSVYDRNGGIIVRTIVHLDPDSDLFMKVAQRAYQDHERSLVPCLKCGRKFFPDRIETHERNCAATKLTDPKEPAENSLGSYSASSSTIRENTTKKQNLNKNSNSQRNSKSLDISGRQRWK